MNKERLLKLADFLETVPEENFDMGAWKCGTVACALGWACSIEEFNAAGLKLIYFADIDFLVPDYEGLKGFAAGANFFGISDEDAVSLFDPGAYSDQEYMERPIMKAEVSARIRELVAHEDAKADADLKNENP